MLTVIMIDDERWALRFDDGVLVAEFPHGTVLTPADAETLLKRWREYLSEGGVDAVVIVVRTSRVCSDSGRHALRNAARMGVDHEVTRWAVVAERSKRGYLQRTVDVADIDVESFNDEKRAVDWAVGESLHVA